MANCRCDIRINLRQRMTHKGIIKTEMVPPQNSPITIGKNKNYPLKAPFNCPICGEKWQPQVGNEGKTTLHDFPKIGCSIKTCADCE